MQTALTQLVLHVFNQFTLLFVVNCEREIARQGLKSHYAPVEALKMPEEDAESSIHIYDSLSEDKDLKHPEMMVLITVFHHWKSMECVIKVVFIKYISLFIWLYSYLFMYYNNK